MKNRIIGALVVACLSIGASAANAASLVTFGDPWGQNAVLGTAMTTAFGTYNNVSSPADTSFLSGETFVYMEGGDGTTNSVEAFLTANAAALMSWVTAGGRLFINAAPNEGDGLTFGGLTLNYDGTEYCGSGCDAVDAMNPMFAGAGTSFGGNYFSHGTVSGGTSYIQDTATSASLLSSLNIGSGQIFMGSMTSPSFHNGGDPALLRANMMNYAATNAAAVPLPAAGWLLVASLGSIGAMRRRARKAA